MQALAHRWLSFHMRLAHWSAEWFDSDVSRWRVGDEEFWAQLYCGHAITRRGAVRRLRRILRRHGLEHRIDERPIEMYRRVGRRMWKPEVTPDGHEHRVE